MLAYAREKVQYTLLAEHLLRRYMKCIAISCRASVSVERLSYPLIAETWRTTVSPQCPTEACMDSTGWSPPGTATCATSRPRRPSHESRSCTSRTRTIAARTCRIRRVLTRRRSSKTPSCGSRGRRSTWKSGAVLTTFPPSTYSLVSAP